MPLSFRAVAAATRQRVRRLRALSRAVHPDALAERAKPAYVLACLVAGAAVLWGSFTADITDWLVQTDELQVVRLAIHIAEDLSLTPTARGDSIGTWSQLYPLLIAPLYGLLGTEDAFRAAHLVNAVLMASTAIPAYLLARELVESRLAAYAVAALSVCIPWLALADMLRDDVAAYPAFTWALLAMQRCLTVPSPRRDALALVAITVATFARTQLVILGPVLLAAVAIHELGFALAAGPRSRSALWAALVRAARGHWLLLAAAVLGLVLALAAGGMDAALGSYQSTATVGDLLPAGIASNVAMHLSMVAVGVGVVPLTFALGWAVATIVRPLDREAHAFAVLMLLACAGVALAASSFVLRNAGTNAFDRYFFYVVPPALVGMAACVAGGRRNWLPAAGAALVFAWVAGEGAFAVAPPPYHQSPATAFYSVLDFHAGRLGLTAAEAARWGGTVAALAAAGLLRFVAPRNLLPLLAVVLLLFGLAETRSVFRSMGGTQLGEPAIERAAEYQPDWIDKAVPDGARVAMLPQSLVEIPAGNTVLNGPLTMRLWWETEFWNARVADAYVLEQDFAGDPTPFAKHIASVDGDTGRLRVAGVSAEELPPYVVEAERRVEIRVAGPVVARTPMGLRLVRAERPYRTPWAVRGLASGGALPAEGGARITVFDGGGRELVLSLVGGFQVTDQPQTITVSMRAGGRVARTSVGQGAGATLALCLPAGRRSVLVRAPQPELPAGIDVLAYTRVVDVALRSPEAGSACR